MNRPAGCARRCGFWGKLLSYGRSFDIGRATRRARAWQVVQSKPFELSQLSNRGLAWVALGCSCFIKTLSGYQAVPDREPPFAFRWAGQGRRA